NAGTLNINSSTALGTSALTIAGGTIDNTSGSAITLSNNNVQNWNGDFASFQSSSTNTSDLNLGTGAVTLGGAGTTRTVTVNGSATLSVGGIAPGATAVGITKLGTGTLAINGASTVTGATALSAGTIRIGNIAALGATTPVTFTGGTLDL